jgi:hypothetical protein
MRSGGEKVRHPVSTRAAPEVATRDFQSAEQGAAIHL